MSETFIDRMREIYLNERDYTIGRSQGEPTDVRDIRRSATIRAFNELTTDEARFAVFETAMLKVSLTSDKASSPRFQEDGSVRLRLTDLLRVADNLVVGVVYATEDDWAAYLGIKRQNFQRQERNWNGTERGVWSRIGELRAYGKQTGIARPRTLDACPYLFADREEEASA